MFENKTEIQKYLENWKCMSIDYERTDIDAVQLPRI